MTQRESIFISVGPLSVVEGVMEPDAMGGIFDVCRLFFTEWKREREDRLRKKPSSLLFISLTSLIWQQRPVLKARGKER